MDPLITINPSVSTSAEERVAQLERENAKLNGQVYQLGDRISKLENCVSALTNKVIGVNTEKQNDKAPVSSFSVDSAGNITLQNILSIEANVSLLKSIVVTNRKAVPAVNDIPMNQTAKDELANPRCTSSQTSTMKVSTLNKRGLKLQFLSKECDLSDETGGMNLRTLDQVQRTFDYLFTSVTPEDTLRALQTLARHHDNVDAIAAQELFVRSVVEERDDRRLPRHICVKLLSYIQNDRTEFSRLLIGEIVSIVFQQFSITMENLPDAQNIFAFNYGCLGDSKSSSLDSYLWPYQKRYLDLIADMFSNNCMNIFDIQRAITIMMDRSEHVKLVGLGYFLKHCGAKILEYTGKINGFPTSSRNAAFPDSFPSAEWFVAILTNLENGKYLLIPKDVEIEIKEIVLSFRSRCYSEPPGIKNNIPERTSQNILNSPSLASDQNHKDSELQRTKLSFVTNITRPMSIVSLGITNPAPVRPVQIAKRHYHNSGDLEVSQTLPREQPIQITAKGAASIVSTNAKSVKEKKTKNASALAAASFVNIPSISEFHDQFLPVSKQTKKKKTAWIKKKFPNKKGSDFEKLISEYLCFALSMKNTGDLAVVVQFFDTMLSADLLEPGMIITAIISDAAKELVRLQKVLDDVHANQCLNACAYLLVGIFEQKRNFDWLVSIGKVLSKKRPNVWKSLSKITVELMHQRFSSRLDDFKKKWYCTGEGREILAKLFMVIRKVSN